MSSNDISILFTMDVEPVAAGPGCSGPVSEEAGERSILGYERVLAARGYRATYFVHPEVAQAQTELILGLRDRGGCLGLHLHTTKFAAAPQEVELGGLTRDRQHDVLAKATELFAASLGFRPTLFRPGCFSANDWTYGLLVELGFVGGSVCIPGRSWPERFCVWTGAYPYAHFAHETFRQCRGELPFVEIPLSVDLTDPLRRHPVGFYHYPDLRPGGVYDEADEVAQDRRQLVRNVMRRMAKDAPEIKTVVVDVHNDRDFAGSDSQAAADLRELLECIDAEARDVGWQPSPKTFDEVIGDYHPAIRKRGA